MQRGKRAELVEAMELDRSMTRRGSSRADPEPPRLVAFVREDTYVDGVPTAPTNE